MNMNTTRLIVIVIVTVVIVGGLFLVARSYEKRIVSEDSSPPSAKYPQRIVSLAPNLTEVLFALGLDEKIVGVSNGSDYPAEAAG